MNARNLPPHLLKRAKMNGQVSKRKIKILEPENRNKWMLMKKMTSMISKYKYNSKNKRLLIINNKII